jgi:hypothetical protein
MKHLRYPRHLRLTDTFSCKAHLLSSQRYVNSFSGELAHLRGVDGFGAAVGAVAAGEHFWIRRLHLFVHNDAAFFINGDAGDPLKEREHLLLTDRFDDEIARDLKQRKRSVSLFAT